MKCPHCLLGIHEDWKRLFLAHEVNGGGWAVQYQTCPECRHVIIYVMNGVFDTKGQEIIEIREHGPTYLAWPRVVSRGPCPPEVPEDFASDYREACAVLDVSPKASAALSRRCLQQVLRGKAGATQRDLSEQIEWVVHNCGLPSYLMESIDAIRNIGNFAAHPMKSTNTGEVLPVEAGEAEWTLDVLESLLDFYFVQPEVLRRKRDALNQKLAEAGKPPMK